MSRRLKCGSCDGSGKSFAHINSTDPAQHGFQWINCMTCGGAGTISEAHAERIAKGRQMRDDRVKRGLSLREEADRLGISVVELSAIEWGRR